LKSIMQLNMTIFPDSASFIEKKRVENRLWRKSEFLWREKNISSCVCAVCASVFAVSGCVLNVCISVLIDVSLFYMLLICVFL
jgi:hypothetical protein